MIDLIDKYCKQILQNDVRFVLNDNKVLRRGKLLLYNTKDFFITFTIDSHKKTRKTYDVYYPFSIEDNTKCNRLEFGYRAEDMSTDVDIQQGLLRSIDPKNPPSQFFGSRLYIYYNGC